MRFQVRLRVGCGCGSDAAAGVDVVAAVTDGDSRDGGPNPRAGGRFRRGQSDVRSNERSLAVREQAGECVAGGRSEHDGELPSMQETAKYLIHASFSADGVVERSDVVGAIFGQTEGLLGEQLDLRELQESSKIGRIDVEVDVTRGQTEGTVTIASGLDRVATATLAASLETLSRIGPCQARCEVTGIEDVRAAKRRQVVERAKELLESAFDDTILSSDEILREVREHVRVEDVTEYEGLPAGPRVAESDAIVVVEGRSDVLQLLKYGIKNAIAVEGTNVPASIADLTAERTVTAFLDGDRGGDLILRELESVGDVDYVAFAPESKSVEDLAHHEVFEALREKVPYAAVADASDPREAIAATDGSQSPAPDDDAVAGGQPGESLDGVPGADATAAEPASPDADAVEAPDTPTVDESEGASPKTDSGASAPEADPESSSPEADPESSSPEADPESSSPEADPESSSTEDETDSSVADADAAATGADESAADDGDEPASLAEHAAVVLGERTGEVVLLDDEYGVLARASASDAFELVRDATADPHAIVVDDELSQRVLDVAAQRGVGHVVARSRGDFVKRPTSVRIRTGEDFGG
jgi:DNA primase